MKKKLIFAIMTGMLLTLIACGNNETNEQPSAAEDGNVSRRIEPLPAALNIDSLDNCTVAASFQAEDVISQDETWSIHMTVYDYESFDLVDIALMSPGDTLVIGGAEILIQSVDRNESVLVAINGGFEEGGFDLYTEETGVYYEVVMGTKKNYYPLGEITLPIAADFVFTDGPNPNNPGKEYDTQGFLTQLETNGVDFNQINTRVTIQDGHVTNIDRAYIPADE